MKKLLSLLLVSVIIFTFCSCGENENVKKNNSDITVNAEDVIEEALDEAEEHDSFSQGAVEYYLKKAVGIKFFDIEPDFAWKLKSDYSAYADDPSSAYGHAVITFTKSEGEVTDEEYNAWCQKVFDITAKASQDGYNIKGYEFSNADEALKEVTLHEALGGFLNGWAFRKDEKIYVVYVSEEYDNNKDSSLGKLFYYDGVKVDIGIGLQKSFGDSMNEAESYLENNEDAIKNAINDYLN